MPSALNASRPRAPETTRRAYSYVRFSTPEQAAGDSFRRQTEAAAAFAKRHGLILDTSLTFQDLGVSGFRGSNVDDGQLGAFLEAVRAGQVEQGSWLLVESLDRLSRLVPRRAARILEEIIDGGVTVVTLADQRVYTREVLDKDPFAFIVAVMMFTRAHEESAIKGRRVRAAWSAKKTTAREQPRGSQPYTRRAPAWLAWDAKAARWKLVSDRAKTLRRIFSLAKSGVGQHRIAAILNDEGISPWGRAQHWHRSYVAKLLKNPAIVGTLTPHRRDYDEAAGRYLRRTDGEPVLGYYPAAVPQPVFDAVQTMHGHRRILGKPASPGLVTHTLAGLAKCSLCGSTMTRVFKGAGNGAPKLVCTRAKRGGGCRYRAVPVKALDDAVFEHARGHILPTVPLTDDITNDAVRNLDAAILAVGGLADDQSDPAVVRHLKRTRDDLAAQREATLKAIEDRSEAVIAARIEGLDVALAAEPHDAPRVNIALKRVFSHVVVDPDNYSLDFVWLHKPDRSAAMIYGFSPVKQTKARNRRTTSPASAGRSRTRRG